MTGVARRWLIAVPGLLAAEGEPSLLREPGRHLRAMAEEGEVVRLRSDVGAGLPEAAWFGLPPHQTIMPAGPPTVAGLGADPPERSVEYRSEWLSLDDEGLVRRRVPPPTMEEARAIGEAVRRLETPKLRWVPGFECVHGLVWLEGPPDQRTTPPEEADGRPVRESWPVGDGESVLRRFVDDSVNLLSPLEANRRRVDEGRAPINLVWPWGGGWRPPMPNLVLRRGGPGRVVTRDLAVAGLARMVGYRPADRTVLGNGFNFDVATIADELDRVPDAILVLDFAARSRAANRLDPAARLMDESLGALFEGLRSSPSESRREVAIVATDVSQTSGIGLLWRNTDRRAGSVPFDERILDDVRVPEQVLARWVDGFFSS